MADETIRTLLANAYHAFDESQFENAEALYQRVIATIPDRKSALYRHAAHMLAFARAHRGDYEGARTLYRELRAEAKARGDIESEHVALHQLGMVERLAENYDHALELFHEEFVLIRNNLDDAELSLSANLFEQGTIAYLRGEFGRAHKMLHEALDYANRAQDAMCRALALRGLAQLSQRQGDRATARAQYLGSVVAFKQAGDERAARDVEEKLRALDT